MKKKVVENVDSRSGVATLVGFKSLALILGIVLLASLWAHDAAAQGSQGAASGYGQQLYLDGYNPGRPDHGSLGPGTSCSHDSFEFTFGIGIPYRPSYQCHEGVDENVPMKLSTCDDVRKSDGRGISGGTAGLEAEGSVCFRGRYGVSNYCAALQSSTYTCAGVQILSGEDVDIDWRDFDISEEEDEETQRAYYGITTRDENRGRAGHDIPLFMNAHGICRKIDNTEAAMNPLFMGVKFEDEWRSVHGVPEGGDPNGGYSHFANNPAVKAAMSTCCAPAMLEICGQKIQTNFAEVGETVSAWGPGGGHAQLVCAGNNEWQAVSVVGICGGGGGGGGGADPGTSSSGGGVYNPNNGGQMTKADWDSLDSGVQSTLKDQGYEPTGGTMTKELPDGSTTQVQSPEDVKVTNDQAAADAQAAQEKAEQDAEDQQKENLENLESAAEDAANEDDPSDDDGDSDCTGVWC